jgi:methionyl-tRNA formyltransferase
MNVVLVAEESAGAHVLRAVAKSKHRLVAVLAKPPKLGTAATSVWKIASELGFPTLPAAAVRTPELAERLGSRSVDMILNVHSLYIIHDSVLRAPRFGAFNLHPGPLPRYAGLNAVSWAIFRGERTHGVTVHRMDPGIDTGPIVYQKLFPVDDKETGLSLSMKCVREGVPLVLRLLETAETCPDQIPFCSQDLTAREYFGREVPNEGWLSWEWPAQKVLNFVRACDFLPFSSPWGHPRARYREQEFSLLKARRTGQSVDVPPGTVGRVCSSGIEVACLDEWVSVSKLVVNGEQVAAQQLLRPGERLLGKDEVGIASSVL